jgi:hypothetical protein
MKGSWGVVADSVDVELDLAQLSKSFLAYVEDHSAHGCAWCRQGYAGALA